MSELMFSAVLYVNCSGSTCKTVLETAKQSPLNTRSFKTRDKFNDVDVVVNLKGSQDEIKTLSKNISSIHGVKSVRCVITK